jgi:hypothetical protein
VVAMENRPPMTKSDVASLLPNSNEYCETPQGGKPRKRQAREPAVAEFKDGSPSELKRRGVTRV